MRINILSVRKDILNKPIVKEKLESVPEDAYVLTISADFIDMILLVVNEFLHHALKNIRVEG